LNILIDVNVVLDVILERQLELERADAMAGSDLEDNLSLACALSARLDVIVTRDPSGFAGSPILVLTPAELLAKLPKVPDA